jgi:hypothetical protein
VVSTALQAKTNKIGVHVYVVGAGAADVQTLTPVPAITAYVTGARFLFIPGYDNTGACTLNVSGLGAKNIKKSDGAGALADPAAADLDTALIADVVYDGTQFILMNPGVSSVSSLSDLGIANHDSIVVDANGIQINAEQVAVCITAGAQSNVTGDSTEYTTLWTTERFDQNADFASSTFTAPVTGRYLIGFNMDLRQLAAGHTSGLVKIVTSNKTYITHNSNVGLHNAVGDYTFTGVIFADMDAADTMSVLLDVRNGSKVVDIGGDALLWIVLLA